MATFKITANSTVKSFSKAFKDEFGATLQIYDGRLKADDSVKLVDIGAKTGTFECRASRTVGSFVKMMNDDFNLKVKVRTADDWVTVIDGLTLNRINDLPKQPTKTQMEDFIGYKRDDKTNNVVKEDTHSIDPQAGYEESERMAKETDSIAVPLHKMGEGNELDEEVKENPYDFMIFFSDAEGQYFFAFDPMKYDNIDEFLRDNPDFKTIYYAYEGDYYMSEETQEDYENPAIWPDEEGNMQTAIIQCLNQTQKLDYPQMLVNLIYNGEIIYTYDLSD